MPSKNVTLYIVQGSVFSDKTREFLRSRGIDFREVDVKSSPEAAEELMGISGQYSVPVVVVGDEIVLGFDEKKLIKLLEE